MNDYIKNFYVYDGKVLRKENANAVFKCLAELPKQMSPEFYGARFNIYGNNLEVTYSKYKNEKLEESVPGKMEFRFDGEKFVKSEK